MSNEGERTKDDRLRERRGLRFEKKKKKREEETDGETREKNE